ncbi:MFS transporter [Nitrospira moscoviensis]|uniref:Putative Permease, MFS family n=1 Tax=Nitrospira moscoviensis TaxID=42253 RepID=A0A0K2GDA4_NITMO|nr:MFS transporter [Nitrospira moscoviensis]ALA58926.1 putative Permease, MFS family [Nitrospira moscoviensis]
MHGPPGRPSCSPAIADATERYTESRGEAAPRPLLLTRDFGLVWSGQLISQIGDGISKLALLWFVYAITGSPLKTSVIGLLQTIPPIVLGPIIGVYVDRLPKKLLLVVSDVLRAVTIGLIPCLIPVEWFTVSVLYGLVLLHAVSTAVFGPALTAAVPAIVPPRHFTAANGLLQATTSLGIVFGPALSGLGIAAYGSQEVLCLNAATYLASAACLMLARFADPAAAGVRAAARSSLWRDLLEGLRHGIARQPVILLLTGTAALYTVGTSALTALFPVFARKLLDLGPVEIGYLWSAMGIGLLLTSIGLQWVTDWPLHERARLVVSTSLLSSAAAVGLIWTSDPYIAGVLMALIGAGMGAFTPIAWGILQESVPRRMIGRALGLYGTAAMTAAIISISLFGWITERFGPQTALLGVGLALGLTGLLAGRMKRTAAG